MPEILRRWLPGDQAIPLARLGFPQPAGRRRAGDPARPVRIFTTVTYGPQCTWTAQCKEAITLCGTSGRAGRGLHASVRQEVWSSWAGPPGPARRLGPGAGRRPHHGHGGGGGRAARDRRRAAGGPAGRRGQVTPPAGHHRPPRPAARPVLQWHARGRCPVQPVRRPPRPAFLYRQRGRQPGPRPGHHGRALRQRQAARPGRLRARVPPQPGAVRPLDRHPDFRRTPAGRHPATRITTWPSWWSASRGSARRCRR